MKKIEFFKIEGDRINRIRKHCPKCGPAVFLAEHKNRFSCGACGYTEFKSGGIKEPQPKVEETPVEQTNGLYLIDDDNDGHPDYQYNTTTAETSEYVAQANTQERKPTLLDMIQPFVIYILIAALIVSISTIPLLIYKIRKTPKVHQSKKKTKAEKTVTKQKEEIKEIERQVDELLAKKEKLKKEIKKQS